MSGNFWKSSHFEQWILEKHDLLRERGEDLKILSEEEHQKIMIFFVNFIQAIGQDANLKIRMQAIATACVYFRRFYARRSFRDVDPFLLAPTCILLASKVEESGMVSLTKLISSVQSALKKWPYLNQDLMIRQPLLQEAEFCMLEIMDCCLIVYHPYRPLNQIIQDMKSTGGVLNTDQLYQDAWRVCNDSLRSDVALLYAPHQIAIASLIVASILNGRDKEKELKNWFSELAVDYEKIFEIEQMIFNMYRVWKSFDESDQLLGLLAKLPRPNGQIQQKRE
uniref:Cyclin-like domain-containing protein n=1 Tax=Ditylenchus dipsaci TaxID=166011 RepID=A0A915CXG0_9BILA